MADATPKRVEDIVQIAERGVEIYDRMEMLMLARALQDANDILLEQKSHIPELHDRIGELFRALTDKTAELEAVRSERERWRDVIIQLQDSYDEMERRAELIEGMAYERAAKICNDGVLINIEEWIGTKKDFGAALCSALRDSILALSPGPAAEALAELRRAKAALIELVACKDLKASRDQYTTNSPQWLRGNSEYSERKRAAWAEARAAIDSAREGE